MKIKRLNAQNQSLDTIELDEKKFQIWKTIGAILQIQNGKDYWIQNAHNFKWATNFISFDEAKRNADIIIRRNNWKGGIKIFSGNTLYAYFTKGEWIIYDNPKKQLM